MARPQEKPAPFTTPYSTIIEREKEGTYDYPDASPHGGCSCFHRFCFGRDEGGSRNYLLQERGGVHKDPWLMTQIKKLKQISELVAGPKWKNFIRKIGKLCYCYPKKYNRQTPVQFHYSPESYALNFAGDKDYEEDGNLWHSFSSRFAPRSG